MYCMQAGYCYKTLVVGMNTHLTSYNTPATQVCTAALRNTMWSWSDCPAPTTRSLADGALHACKLKHAGLEAAPCGSSA